MYYLEGLKSISDNNRWFLVDKTPFLTDIFIRCINSHYNLKSFKISKKEHLPDFLDQRDSNVLVLIEDLPDDLSEYKYLIKISKQPITKKWKEAQFVEVVCSDLFPNQIASFISFLNQFNLLTTKLTDTESSLLIERYYHNLEELFEVLQLLSYKHDLSFIQASKERSTTGLVEAYLDGNFNLFFQSVLSERVDWNLLITLLIHNLIYMFKVKNKLIKVKSPWLKTKILKRCLKFEKSFIEIILYVQDIENRLRQGFLVDARLPLLRLSLFIEQKMSL